MFNLISVFANEILIALWYMITNERNLLFIYKGKRKKRKKERKKERKQKQVLHHYNIVSASKMLTDLGKDAFEVGFY